MSHLKNSFCELLSFCDYDFFVSSIQSGRLLILSCDDAEKMFKKYCQKKKTDNIINVKYSA